MKKIFRLMIITISLYIISCKDKNEDPIGKIIGEDSRCCICCGGYFIQIDQNSYRFRSLPAGSGINLNTVTFPIYVNVAFHKMDTQCWGDEIIIERIRMK